MGKYILIHGNPVDGFKFVGPFIHRESAVECGNFVGEADWWITEISPASDYYSEKELAEMEEVGQ